jgi:hypothetical protein
MNIIDGIAKELHMRPNELVRESIRTYLEQRLSKIETEIFVLAKKYGVNDVFELDSRVKEGLISEKDAYDDYFTFDNLEADREKIKKLLEEI